MDTYKKALDKAGSKLDFVFGINLYMAPSDISLNITRNIAGYNNKILIATDDLLIGLKYGFYYNYMKNLLHCSIIDFCNQYLIG